MGRYPILDLGMNDWKEYYHREVIARNYRIFFIWLRTKREIKDYDMRLE